MLRAGLAVTGFNCRSWALPLYSGYSLARGAMLFCDRSPEVTNRSFIPVSGTYIPLYPLQHEYSVPDIQTIPAGLEPTGGEGSSCFTSHTALRSQPGPCAGKSTCE